MKKNIWIIIIVLAVAATGFLIFKSSHKDTRTEVTVEVPSVRNLVSTVSATGEVEPVVQVKVSAEIPGRITELTVKEGDRVEKDEHLVELDPKLYTAALESATSGLRSAKGQKDKADADLKRIKGLIAKGMASQADLDAATAAGELYSGQLEQAVAQEKQARENLSKTRIAAPMTGTVSRLNKEVGELTLGSQFQEDIIMVVADLTKMEVKAQVDENDIVGVKVGDSAGVQIDAFPDTTFRGRVAEISQSAATAGAGATVSADQGKNFDVKVAIIDTIKGIRPGMSATVDIATDHRDSVVAVSLQCVAVRDKKKGKAVELKEKEQPKSSRELAAQARQGTQDTSKTVEKTTVEEGVFVLGGDTAVWKPVRTGLSSDRYIEIVSGLAAKDTVISGPYRALAKDLSNGDRVKIKPPEKDKKDKKKS